MKTLKGLLKIFLKKPKSNERYWPEPFIRVAEIFTNPIAAYRVRPQPVNATSKL